jgi:hypothetical protein
MNWQHQHLAVPLLFCREDEIHAYCSLFLAIDGALEIETPLTASHSCLDTVNFGADVCMSASVPLSEASTWLRQR